MGSARPAEPGPDARVVVFRPGGQPSADGPGAIGRVLDEGRRTWVEIEVPAGSGAATAARDALAGIGSAGSALAVVAVGAAADSAVQGASSDPRVVAIAVIAATVSADIVDLVASWKEVPVFVVANGTNRASLPSAVALRQESTHPDSDIEFVNELDIEGEHFGSPAESWALAVRATVRWLDRVLDDVGERQDVVCVSTDGWEIHGTLTIPIGSGPSVPAAVLLHSGRSDRAVFSRLERLLARRGIASLSIDWRGRGSSQNRGTYFDLTAAERAEGWRDARAAADLLASHPRIDGSRLAMVGVVHGAEHAVAAAVDDPRVTMLALLTGYVPRNEREEHHLLSGSVDVLYVTCTAHGPVTDAMRDLLERSQPGQATLRVYPGGAIGYQLFDLDDRLEDDLTTWLGDGLTAQTATVS